MPTPPPLHRPKSSVAALGSVELPRRSKRVAAHNQTRVSNPVAQVQHVLMHKLGITSDERSLDVDAYVEYTKVFHGPLSFADHAAIRTLFHGEPPVPEVVPEEEQ